MNQIIEEIVIKTATECETKMTFYTDDTVPLAKQHLLRQFIIPVKTYNMVVAKEPIRCKLKPEGSVMEKIMNFNYLNPEPIAETRVMKQILLTLRIAGIIRVSLGQKIKIKNNLKQNIKHL